MKPVFADTVYFLALLNPADQWHPQARSLSVRADHHFEQAGFQLLMR